MGGILINADFSIYCYTWLVLMPQVPSILLSVGTWGSCRLACPTIGFWLHPWLWFSLTGELSGHLSEHCYPEGLAFFPLLLSDLT